MGARAARRVEAVPQGAGEAILETLRTVRLPAQLDVEKVAADYRDGVLTVRLPRADSERPRTVSING